MSKAEKFIQDCTKHNTNYIGFINKKTRECYYYVPWLTPDEARKAVEIARKEMAERACDAYCKVCGHYAHTTPVHICRQACDYYKNFIQAMKDEVS